MKYACFFFLLFVVGCSHTAQIASYRPRGSSEIAWNVKVEQNSLSGHVNVIVNDSVVCDGTIGVFESGEELKGNYRGHPVIALLERSSSLFTRKTVCIVMIDGEMAGKFEL